MEPGDATLRDRAKRGELTKHTVLAAQTTRLLNDPRSNAFVRGFPLPACGSNIRTGHELSNCPTIISGGGASLKLGHSSVAPKDTPLCNAWLTMRHGDSTGVLKAMIA